jgi:hypothetical protein
MAAMPAATTSTAVLSPSAVAIRSASPVSQSVPEVATRTRTSGAFGARPQPVGGRLAPSPRCGDRLIDELGRARSGPRSYCQAPSCLPGTAPPAREQARPHRGERHLRRRQSAHARWVGDPRSTPIRPPSLAADWSAGSGQARNARSRIGNVEPSWRSSRHTTTRYSCGLRFELRLQSLLRSHLATPQPTLSTTPVSLSSPVSAATQALATMPRKPVNRGDTPNRAMARPGLEPGTPRFSGHENAGRGCCPGSAVASGDRDRGSLGNAGWAGRSTTDGLRARDFQWPPLRLARLCREHESVCVVCPPELPHRR